MRFQTILTGWLILGFGPMGCNAYKPGGYVPTKSSVNSTGTEVGSKTDALSASPIALGLATTKFPASAVPFQAEIVFQPMAANPAAQQAAPKTTVTREFTVGSADIKLDLAGLPTDVDGLISVFISQNGEAKFVAKRANTRLLAGQVQLVLIDDCLILPAPWDGVVHDGSCEWTVEDVN